MHNRGKNDIVICMRTPEILPGFIKRMSGAVVGGIALVSMSSEVAMAQSPTEGQSADCVASGLQPVEKDGIVYANVSSLPDGSYGLVVGGMPIGTSAKEAQAAFDDGNFAPGFDQRVLGYETGEDCLAVPLGATADCRDLQGDLVNPSDVVNSVIEDEKITKAEAIDAGAKGVVIAGAVISYEAEECEDVTSNPNRDNGVAELVRRNKDALALTGAGLLGLVAAGSALISGGALASAKSRRKKQ